MAMRPWEQLHQTLSKNFRQNLRTASNRAKSIENLRFESADSMPRLRVALGMFLEIEASGWKASAGTAIKQDPGLARFYEELVQRLSPRGGCEIHLLREGEKAIAGLLLFIVDRTVYMPKVAYDEKYARLSPVQLLLENLFKECEKRPDLEEFNLVSAAGWFDVWKPRRAGVYDICVFNTTMVGLLGGAALRSAASMGILPRVVRFGQEFLRRR
jgi:CelD/BcsL family acetyltransferase involved in cellulose biosynthesis